MKLKRLIGGLCMCATLLAATMANAALVRFTLSGDYSASWELDALAVPSDYSIGTGFVLWNVAGTFSGAVQPEADLTFFNSAAGGGLNIYDFQSAHNLLATDGPQLYSGPESSPTFRLGTFALSEFGGTGSYTLTVAEVSAVPEPGSGALALAALGLLYLVRPGRTRTC